MDEAKLSVRSKKTYLREVEKLDATESQKTVLLYLLGRQLKRDDNIPLGYCSAVP